MAQPGRTAAAAARLSNADPPPTGRPPPSIHLPVSRHPAFRSGLTSYIPPYPIFETQENPKPNKTTYVSIAQDYQASLRKIAEDRSRAETSRLLHADGPQPPDEKPHQYARSSSLSAPTLPRLNLRRALPMEPRATRTRAGISFTKDIRPLLFAFGDVSEPLECTVALLDDCVSEFLQDLALQAAVPAAHAGRAKVKLDDLWWAARERPAMIGRAREILRQEKIIAKQRKITTEDQEARALAVAETRRAARLKLKGAAGAGAGSEAGGGPGRRRKRKAGMDGPGEGEEGDDAESVAVTAQGSNGGRKRRKKLKGVMDGADDSESVRSGGGA